MVTMEQMKNKTERERERDDNIKNLTIPCARTLMNPIRYMSLCIRYN